MSVFAGEPWVGALQDVTTVPPAGPTGSTVSSTGGFYDGPSTTSCPSGTSTIDIDFNSGVDDFGSSKGTLRFTGKQGFVVYFTDDNSDGGRGNADGVEITSQQYGNCHAAGNCNAAQASKSGGFVLGANNDAGDNFASVDYHTSGVVAVFNQGATKVSFMDTDDDGTLKAVFAYDKDGNFIGQSTFASRQDVAIDTSQTTDNALIYSLEFDTLQGTAGGSNDGTVFTIDNFHAEGACADTQIGSNPLMPCRSDCPDNTFVSGCSGDDQGTCSPCDPANCPIGYFLTGCGGFGAGTCISDPAVATSDPSAVDAVSCSSTGSSAKVLLTESAGVVKSGETAADCDDHYSPQAKSGVYRINPGTLGSFEVYCDFDMPDGPWTVFQRREDGSVDFYRDYSEYIDGFGSLTGEFWLGLEKIRRLTELDPGQMQLRFDLCDDGNGCRVALYSTFSLADAADKYRLTAGGFSSGSDASPGDSFTGQSGHQFSARDQDNDVWSSHCAQSFHGAWWYSSCHGSNLNGGYGRTSYADGLSWNAWLGYHNSLERASMAVSHKDKAPVLSPVNGGNRYKNVENCEAACDSLGSECVAYVWSPANAVPCALKNSTSAIFVSEEHADDDQKRPQLYIKSCGKGCGNILDPICAGLGGGTNAEHNSEDGVETTQVTTVPPAGPTGSTVSSTGGFYDGPSTTSCPSGTSTIDIDFNSGVDDFGSSKGTLRFTGKQGFVVYFTDDNSDGGRGNADGVEITSQQYGNCHAAGNCNAAQASKSGGFVLGANNDAGDNFASVDYHTSGVVAVFNQGATKVSFMDTDDDGTLKAVFAYDKDGNFIGQSTFASRQDVAIDTSQTTDNALIYSLEFDTLQGTAGGSNDGTVFTIDNFHAEGACADTQIGSNPLMPCRSDCPDNTFVSGCSGDDQGTCSPCDPANCPIGYFLTGCGGFGAGTCISDPAVATSDPSAVDAVSCSSTGSSAKVLLTESAGVVKSGETAADCDDHYSPQAKSGVYRINPGTLGSFEVYCDFDMPDGPWTVFQRREDGSVDFYRDYSEYIDGFGSLTGEFWLGLEKIRRLTELDPGQMQLRFDLCDDGNGCRVALYSTFSLADAADKYRLTAGGFSSGSDASPGDSFTGQSGHQFSARDQDNDVWSSHCAQSFHGAWSEIYSWS